MSPQTKLFHYTTGDGLLGILESNCIWATHYKCLNDAKEFRYASDITFQDVYPKAKDLIKKSSTKLHPEVLKVIHLEKEVTDIVRKASNIFYETMNRMDAQPFVLSFYSSDKKDVQANGLLSLWRGYGADGGYAIEFFENDLQKLIQDEASQYAHGASGFSPVVYEPDTEPATSDYYKYRMNVASQAMGMISSYLEGKSYQGAGDPTESTKASLNFMSLTKHPGFKEENEWRMWLQTYEEKIGKDPEPGSSRSLKEHFYRNRDGLIVPYIKLFQNRILQSMKQIIIGPHPNKDLRYEMVKAYCENHNLSIKISKSRIPYVT